MATKTINIFPIKIMLDTNIPGAASGANSGSDPSSFIPFDKSLIHSSAAPGSVPLQTGSFNNYPYFTMDVKYPETYLLSIPYDKRFEFFFNKQMMTRVLKSQPVLQSLSGGADEKVAVKSDGIDIDNLIQKLKLPQETNQTINTVINYILKNFKELHIQIKKAAERDIGLKSTADKWNPNFFKENVPELLKFFEFLNSDSRISGVLNDMSGVLNDVNKMKLYEYKDLTAIPQKEIEPIGKISTKIGLIRDDNEISKTVKKVLTDMNNKIKEQAKIEQNAKDKETAAAKKEQEIKQIETQKEEENKQIEADQIKKDKDFDANMRIKKQQYENGEFNILCMIRILFSTKYPFSGNNLSSFQMIVKRNPEFNFKFSDFLPGFVREAIQPITYTYLKIKGKVYTVTQTVWMNDIYNHPDYKVLVQKFQTLMSWKENEKVNLEKDIGDQMGKFKSPSNNFTESDITDISGQRKPFNDDITKEIRTSYITFNNAIDAMITAIRSFNESLTGTDIDVILDNANNLKMAYDDLLKLGFKTKQKYTTIVTSIQKQLDIVQTDEYILKNYISPPEINMNYENEKDIYKQRLQQKFGKYVDFTETIKQFISPNKESTNVFLQETIDRYKSNTSNVFNDIMNIEKFGSIPQGLPTDEKKIFEKRKNTGITIVYDKNQPIYEIFLLVNCIGGELTDDNKSAIDCLYKNDFLGNRMEYLVNESVSNIWEINTNRVYFDLEDARVQQKIEAAAAAGKQQTQVSQQAQVQQQSQVSQQSQAPAKKGGTRKARAYFIKHYGGTRRVRW